MSANLGPHARFSIAPDGVVTFNNAYSFPSIDGTTGYVLTTDGAGVVTWQSNSATPPVYFIDGSRNIRSTNAGTFVSGSDNYFSGIGTGGANLNTGSDNTFIGTSFMKGKHNTCAEDYNGLIKIK